MEQEADRTAKDKAPVGGLAGWLLGKLRVARRPAPRLAVLERIALAPRQSLLLVEAEGRRFLLATSAQGTPAFQALDGNGRQPRADRDSVPMARSAGNGKRPAKRPGSDRDLRVSW